MTRNGALAAGVAHAELRLAATLKSCAAVNLYGNSMEGSEIMSLLKLLLAIRRKAAPRIESSIRREGEGGRKKGGRTIMLARAPTHRYLIHASSVPEPE